MKFTVTLPAAPKPERQFPCLKESVGGAILLWANPGEYTLVCVHKRVNAYSPWRVGEKSSSQPSFLDNPTTDLSYDAAVKLGIAGLVPKPLPVPPKPRLIDQTLPFYFHSCDVERLYFVDAANFVHDLGGEGTPDLLDGAELDESLIGDVLPAGTKIEIAV